MEFEFEFGDVVFIKCRKSKMEVSAKIIDKCDDGRYKIICDKGVLYFRKESEIKK